MLCPCGNLHCHIRLDPLSPLQTPFCSLPSLSERIALRCGSCKFIDTISSSHSTTSTSKAFDQRASTPFELLGHFLHSNPLQNIRQRVRWSSFFMPVNNSKFRDSYENLNPGIAFFQSVTLTDQLPTYHHHLRCPSSFLCYPSYLDCNDSINCRQESHTSLVSPHSI